LLDPTPFLVVVPFAKSVSVLKTRMGFSICKSLSFYNNSPFFLFISLVLKGEFTHETGDGNSGCFGLDNTDPIKSLSTSKTGTKWELFSGFSCTGTSLADGTDA